MFRIDPVVPIALTWMNCLDRSSHFTSLPLIHQLHSGIKNAAVSTDLLIDRNKTIMFYWKFEIKKMWSKLYRHFVGYRCRTVKIVLADICAVPDPDWHLVTLTELLSLNFDINGDFRALPLQSTAKELTWSIVIFLWENDQVAIAISIKIDKLE